MTYPDATVVTHGYNSRNLLTSVVHPTLGSTAYTYDIDGRPVSETLADGTARSWAYDGEGRTISYTEGTATAYSYEQLGHINAVTDSSGRSTMTVDDSGRLS